MNTQNCGVVGGGECRRPHHSEPCSVRRAPCAALWPQSSPPVSTPDQGTAWVRGAMWAAHWRAFRVQKVGPMFGLVVPTGRQSA